MRSVWVPMPIPNQSSSRRKKVERTVRVRRRGAAATVATVFPSSRTEVPPTPPS